jgi:hypothetical protein
MKMMMLLISVLIRALPRMQYRTMMMHLPNGEENVKRQYIIPNIQGVIIAMNTMRRDLPLMVKDLPGQCNILTM